MPYRTRAIRIVSRAAELSEDASDQTLIIPQRLNPALPVTVRLPAFECATQVRAAAARIHRGLDSWAAFSARVTARNTARNTACTTTRILKTA
jgi:hypothetical protein